MNQPTEIHIGLIVLGASKFLIPTAPENAAFLRSKEAFKAAIASAGSVTEDRILDLFDKELSVGGIVDEIDQFFRRHKTTTDIIFYYCGHGGFTKKGEFFLTLRTTRQDRESSEGLNLRTLRADLDDWLAARRVYLILDCCFAGAALLQWMNVGGVTTQLADQVFGAFPKKGTALIAAAPAAAPAKAFDREEYTVFTGALVRALNAGAKGFPRLLSFREIFQLAESIIKLERAGVAPIPEMHPRAHEHSDIARTPMFANMGAVIDHEYSAWAEVSDSQNAEALYGFLAKYPAGKFEAVADARFRQRLAAEARSEVMKRLLDAPGSPLHRELIAARLSAIEWSRVRAFDDIVKINDFIKRFPNTPEHASAINRAAEIAWLQIRKTKDLSALERFIDQFAETPSVAGAQARLKELRRIDERRRARTALLARIKGRLVVEWYFAAGLLAVVAIIVGPYPGAPAGQLPSISAEGYVGMRAALIVLTLSFLIGPFFGLTKVQCLAATLGFLISSEIVALVSSFERFSYTLPYFIDVTKYVGRYDLRPFVGLTGMAWALSFSGATGRAFAVKVTLVVVAILAIRYGAIATGVFLQTFMVMHALYLPLFAIAGLLVTRHAQISAFRDAMAITGGCMITVLATWTYYQSFWSLNFVNTDSYLMLVVICCAAPTVLSLVVARAARPQLLLDIIRFHRDHAPTINKHHLSAVRYGLAAACALSIVLLSNPDISRAPESPEETAVLERASRQQTIVEKGALPADSDVVLQTSHRGSVTSVVYSPDGRSVLAGSKDGTLKLWDIASGVLLRTFEAGKFGMEFTAIAIAPDGQTVAAANGRSILLWDTRTGRQTRRLSGHNDSVTSLFFAADGRTLLSGGDDHVVKLWQVASGAVRQTFAGHEEAVRSVALSSDGSQIASGGADGKIIFWDGSTGKPRTVFDVGGAGVTTVKFSPAGQLLLSGSQDGALKLWNIANARMVKAFPPLGGPILSASFSADGRKIISGTDGEGGGNYTIRIWDVASTKAIVSFGAGKRAATSVALSADGRTAVSGSLSLYLWDAATGQELKRLGDEIKDNWYDDRQPWRITRLLPDGKTVVSAAGYINSTAQFWDISSGRLVKSVAGDCPPEYRDSSADARQAVSYRSWDANNAISLCDLATGATLKAYPWRDSEIEAMAFAPDGMSLALGTSSGSVRLWDRNLARTIKSLPSRGKSKLLRYSPNGRTLLGVYEDTILLWDVVKGEISRAIKDGSPYNSAATFGPQGRTVAVVNRTGSILLWDAVSAKLLRTFENSDPESDVVLAFSPDAKLLASGGNPTLKMWNVDSGELLGAMEGHADKIESLEFTRDGEWLVSTSKDRSLKVWRVSDRALAATTLVENDDWITIRPDGYVVSSVDPKQLVVVVDRNTMSPIPSFFSERRRDALPLLQAK